MLGLKAEAGEAEIRAAYREQAKRYHPDRFAHLDDEFQALAHRRFLEIRRAFDELLRGEDPR